MEDALRSALHIGGWAGLDASGYTWEPLDNITNCAEAIAAFERAAPSRALPLPCSAPPAALSVVPSPPIAPAGFAVDAAPHGRNAGGAAAALLVARRGWQRGTVARLCLSGAFSCVAIQVAWALWVLLLRRLSQALAFESGIRVIRALRPCAPPPLNLGSVGGSSQPELRLAAPRRPAPPGSG